MADNLESYFKKHLSDENPKEESWNVPSDDVWNNVLPEIQKKRGLFIPWKYLYIIGALLVVGLAIILWPIAFSDKVSSPKLLTENEKSTISTQENSDESSQNQSNQYAISNNDGNRDKAQNESSSIPDRPEQLLTINDNQGTSTSNIQGFNQNKQQIENETSPEINPSDDVYKNTSQTAIQSTATIITAEKETDNQQHFLNEVKELFLPTDAHASGYERDEIYITELAQRKSNNIVSIKEPVVNIASIRYAAETPFEIEKKRSEPFDNKHKVGIGAFYAPTWNGTSLSGNPQTGEIQTSNMLLYSGNWGFEFKYFISNRFALITGVEKSEIKSWSKSLVDFGYDISTEHIMPDGEKENTSAVPMQTPFGEINTEVTYRFSGDQQIPDGEIMNSELETHQEIRYLSIPLGVEFNILRFSRFSWFAEAGVRYNRALKDATQFSSRILHTGDDMAVVDEQMMSQPTYTENYLNFYIGTGMNYQVSPAIQINASGHYFGNITDVNLQGDMKTYVDGIGLKIGILYLF